MRRATWSRGALRPRGLGAASSFILLLATLGCMRPAQLVVEARGDLPLNRDALRPGSIEARNSPQLVVDPRTSERMVVAERVDRPRFGAELYRTTDGGKSWGALPFPTPPDQDRPFAPDLAWAADGRLYLVFVTLMGPGNSPGAVWLTSSEDAGTTWTPARTVLGPHAFQVRISTDPVRPSLYLTWLQANEEAVHCLNCFAEVGLPILAARSTDGGVTWSAPSRVSPATRLRVGAPSSVVGPNGVLYVLYYDFQDDRVTWENLEGQRYTGTYELVLARSTDGGATWTEHVVEPAVVPSDRFLVYLPPFPSLAVGPDGVLYVAWHDARFGDRDVFLRRSTDGGASWELAVRVNDDPRGSGADQYLPRVAVAPDGRVDVVFYDRRGDPFGILAEVWLASSFDGGRSFARNVRLSSAAHDSRVGPGSERQQTDLGTRIALASLVGHAVAVWTDARNGSLETDKQDLYAGFAAFYPGFIQDKTPDWSPLLAAAGGALGLAGLVLLGAARRVRRHAPGSLGAWQ